VLPDTPMPAYRPSPLIVRNAIRDVLAGAGLTEVVTQALVSPRMVERFPAPDDGPLAAEPEQRAAGRPVVVTNPLSSQHAVLRQSVLGSVLEVLATNLRYGRDDVAIFEVGKGYGATDDPPSHEWWRLAFALTGAAEPPAWNRVSRPYDLDDAKGILEAVLHRLGYAAPAYAPLTDDPNLHPGRTARVDAGGQLVGRVGELHPATIEALDLRAERVVVAEVAIAGLAGGQLRDPIGATPSRHPSVARDLAIVVAESTSAATVEAAIRQHGGPLLRAVVLFDIYRGRPLDATDKSLAYRLTLRDDERTLTENDVDGAVAAVVAGLAADLGARIRT
jgi:phenylalanyl-tRNA synthetase beta chain